MMQKILFFILFQCALTQAQNLNYYFGNIHAHTSYSDGNQDSASSGMTTPLQGFNYANQSQHIDFYGISEHNHYSAGMPSPAYFKKGLEDANTATIDGQFVAMYGMEWGVISSGGHVIVYGFDSLCGWDFGQQEIQVPEANYAKLFQTINRKTGSFAYLAHPQSDDYGNLFTQTFNAVADKALVGIAMRSGPAYSSNTTYSNPSSSSFLSRYNDALKRGYHVGPGIDHDTHNSVFGRQSAGRLVVQAPLLNRMEILNAFRQRRFYASDDWNTEVNFNIDNLPMGSVITQAGNPTLNVSVNDPDGESITSITVYSGVAGSGNAPTQLTTVNSTNTLNYTHTATSNLNYYYYVYIVQADGNKIWTAPIWYTRNDNIAVPAPSADFDNTMAVCSNNPIMFEDNSSNAPNSWWWTANGAYPSNSSLQNPTFNFPNPGTYQITLVCSNQAGSNTITKNITVQASPTVNIQAVDSLCKGKSVSLQASGASSYVWSNGPTTAINVVSPQINTSYTVTGFQNTCYSSNSIDVKVYQALSTPTITNYLDTLISSYSQGNQWFSYYSPITGATNNFYLPTATGLYMVQFTDSAGCKSEFSLPYSVVLGIAQNDFELRNSYKIYPNPSQGIIHVSSEAVHFNVKVEVLTSTGYLVHKQEIVECNHTRPTTINLSHLSKGMYIVKLQTDIGVYESKIQIE
jgi:PKD repeat protein